MATAWFIAPYVNNITINPAPMRWCAMDTYTPQVFADGGTWEEIECGADRAIVKVKASSTTLTTIAQDPTIIRIPINLLDDSLSSLTTNQKNAIQTQLNAMGYTNTEILNALGNDLGSKTLRQLFRFVTQRRIPPRFDIGTQTIVFDSPPATCTKQFEDVDGRIT